MRWRPGHKNFSPNGVLVTEKGVQAVEETRVLLEQGATQIFQATFFVDGLLAMMDVLEWDTVNEFWVINEVKGTTSQDVKKEEHLNDATFQKIVTEKAGLRVGRVNLIELNKEFRKDGEIIPSQLLQATDISEIINELEQSVVIQIDSAKEILKRDEEPRVLRLYLQVQKKTSAPRFHIAILKFLIILFTILSE